MAASAPGIMPKRLSVREGLEGTIAPILFRDKRGRICRYQSPAEIKRLSAIKAAAERGPMFTGESPVDAEAAVTPGVRNEMLGTYMTEYEQMESALKSFGIEVTTSNKRAEIYAFPESAPYPARQDRGRAPKEESFAFRQFSITNYAWALRVPYHVDDVDDDLTGGLMAMARMAGVNFASLDERIFIQQITGATDADLMPFLVTCPDGVGLYYATDGNGADRFGVSGGNIIAGTATPSGNDIYGYHQQVMALFRKFKNPKNQPLINPKIIKQGITYVYGPSNEAAFKQAFLQKLSVQPGVGGAANSVAAASNVIIDAGDNVMLYNTPRITTTAVYAFLNGAPVKPLVKQARRELYAVRATEGTSDFSRDKNQEYDQMRLRAGWGANIPYGTIRITNGG